MIEQVRLGVSAKRTRVCIFDFDGTLSLIRSGWMDVMIPMMTEVLAETKTRESEEQLRNVVEEFVWQLTGKQTIYQMIRLAEEVVRRGGTPRDPLEYKQMYLERLHSRIASRLDELRHGELPDKYLVPGARKLLESLRDRGLKLYLASGTDEQYVREEAALLDATQYFDGRVFGALKDYQSFSKKILIESMIATAECRGEELLGFGDGYVEIENVKQVEGVAVGVATAEPECLTVDEWKRQRLTGVGADFIIPNYLETPLLMHKLFANGN